VKEAWSGVALKAPFPLFKCLRLHPPIGYAMPRDTPPGGAVICGLFIPGGVAVGVPAVTIGRHPMVYKNPDK